MKKVYLILIGVMLLGGLDLHGQDKFAKRAFRKGKRYYKRNDYIRSTPYLLEAFNLDPENPELAYMLGKATYLGDQPREALPYLVAAYELDSEVSEDLEYYLARSLHYDHQFDEAIEHYEADLDRYEAGSLQHTDTRARIQQCKNAPDIIKLSKNIKVENLGEFVNTEYPEYAATFADGYSFMIFTTRRPRHFWQRAKRRYHVDDINEEVYQSVNDNGVWRRTKLFVKPIPMWLHDASIALSEDGKTLIYYVDKNNFGDIYVSEKQEDGKWSKRESIGDNINTKKSNEPSVFIADEGETLYWVSDRPGGKGMKDIYVSRRQGDGWSDGVSIGDHINTEFDEDAPFVSADGKTLYFASRGLTSMGGYDMFMCEKLPDGTWSKPRNMGTPINTVGDEIYYVEEQGVEGGFYFTSDRPGGYGEKDIYHGMPFTPEEMPNTTVVAGTVLDKVNGEPRKAMVWLSNSITGERLDSVMTDSVTGAYRFVLPQCGDEYAIDVEVEGGGTEEMPVGKVNIVAGKIRDAVTEQPLDAQVELIDMATGMVIDRYNSNPLTGSYLMPVQSGKRYMLRVKSYQYLPYYEEFRVLTSGEIQSHYEIIDLQKHTEANKLVITWQFFDHDQHIIKRDYYKDLENVVNVLNKLPSIRLNVIGHTDSDGTDAYNQVLSERRAEAVAAYLIERGIDRKRLNISGLGESMPIYDNSNPEFKKWNRRVELYIIE